MKTILITGHTELLTSKLLEQLSGRFSVVMTSTDADREEINARVYNAEPGTQAFEQLFWAYDFYAVWYFSPYLDGGASADDFTKTRIIYNQCKENAIKKLIIVSSTFLNNEQKMQEEKILMSAGDMETGIVILRLPFVLVAGSQHTFLGKVFEGVKRNVRSLSLPHIKDDDYEFFPMREVFSLMKKITLAGRESGVYNLPGEYTISKEQMQREISESGGRTRLQTSGEILDYSGEGDISQLMARYGFIIRNKKQLDFSELYDQYLEEVRQTASGRFSFIKKIRSKIPKHTAGILDLVVLFILAEIISRYTANVVYFNMVDVRLIYIFLIASFHGLQLGVVASLAVCVMLFLEYNSIGIYGTQLFYNVENWIPFALCIITGALAGYFSDLRENENQLIKRENDLLREKYLFLNDMYHVTSEVRDEYRTQILTFDNSYGKIYDAIEQLTCDSVQEVCYKAQEVLSNLLNNGSLAIYRLDQSKNMPQAASFVAGYKDQKLEKVYTDGKLGEMLQTVRQGKTWINIGLNPGVPMYAIELIPQAGGQSEGKLNFGEHFLILLWDAMPEQMNDYYANQFEILCRLTGTAINRAALIESKSSDTNDNI